MDIAEFVKARLDDDERYVCAVKAAGERLKANPDPRMAQLGMSAADALLDNWDDLAEFTRWKCAVPADLDRQLREVAAKRAILAEHTEIGRGSKDGPICNACVNIEADPMLDDIYVPYPCKTVRLLASIWSDHPDYREEWKP